MYSINNESLREKIEKCQFSSDEEENKNFREILLNLVSGLSRYTEQVNQTLVNGILKKNCDSNINDIVVALLPNDDDQTFESVGLYKMTDKEEERIFINDEYENIRVLNGDTSGKKKFKGRFYKNGVSSEFEYELRFDRSFLKLQEMLYKFTELYTISNPVILSPYSHKSFRVVYDTEILKEKNVELDFCFEENGIKAVKNKNLFWNFKREIVEKQTYDAKIPYGTNTRYHYSFNKTKKGKYVFPCPMNNQTIIYDVAVGDNGVELVTDRDMDDFILLEYFEVDMNSALVKKIDSSGLLNSNKIDYKGTVTGRIVSEGDIEHALAPFSDWNNLKCCVISEDNKKIMRYSSRYRVDRKDRMMFSTICTRYIHFSKKDGLFLTDYANYVMEYLEYYYPEIEWAGER